MMDVDKVRIKERIADENYERFNRNYMNKNYQEASINLYNCLEALISAVALIKDEEINSYSEIMNFLNQMQKAGEISQEDINTIRYLYINGLRGTMDEMMFEVYKERAERIINKLKRVLKDNLINV